MAEDLFKYAEEYNQLLNAGLRLSGEDKHYFARERMKRLKAWLPSEEPIERILDFGCGIGDTTVLLAEVFPKAAIVGIDDAGPAIEYARQRYQDDQVRFLQNHELDPGERFDVCYCNGVFHHITASERPEAMTLVHRALKPGGWFAVFENNPWNPGTRMIMKRIPFDRDAELINPFAIRRLLRAHGFAPMLTRHLFFFPRMLRFLRWTEGALSRIPMGAQFTVLSRRDTSPVRNTSATPDCTSATEQARSAQSAVDCTAG